MAEMSLSPWKSPTYSRFCSLALWVAMQGCGDVDPTWPEKEEQHSPPSSCGGACTAEVYNICTCAPGDPCGWRFDGACDVPCLLITQSTTFDDSADCSSEVCVGYCRIGFYDSCTCSISDPCQWAADGYCDESCLESQSVEEMFDDSSDC